MPTGVVVALLSLASGLEAVQATTVALIGETEPLAAMVAAYAKASGKSLTIVSDPTAAAVVFSSTAGPVAALADRLAPLPGPLLEAIPPAYHGSGGTWAGVALNPQGLLYKSGAIQVDDLPDGLDRLDDPEWKERVAWAPADPGFQTMITVMRHLEGEAPTRAWLEAMRDNGAQAYPTMAAALEAVAAGTRDGTPGPYRLAFPASPPPDDSGISGYIFVNGDAGSFLDLVSIGLGPAAAKDGAAVEFLSWLVSASGQHTLATQRYYPAVSGIAPDPRFEPLDAIIAPQIAPKDLGDAVGTQSLLQATGLLP